MTEPTAVQMQILRERFPQIGEPALRRNWRELLGPDAKPLATPVGRTWIQQGVKPAKQRVARTRNGGTWTEAQYWQRLRWALRKTFQWWKPAMGALKRAKVGKLYRCADCGKLFGRKSVHVDHKEPAGTLTSPEHLAPFLERLTPESPDAFAVRCKPCHQRKTNAEREQREAA